MMKVTEPEVATLLIKGAPTVDGQEELNRARKVLKKDIPFIYKALNVRNLKDLPNEIALAAQSGHWVLLDNLDEVMDYVPAIEKFLRQLFDYQKD